MNRENYFPFAEDLEFSGVEGYVDSLEGATESQIILSVNGTGRLRRGSVGIDNRLSMNIGGTVFRDGKSVNFSLRRSVKDCGKSEGDRDDRIKCDSRNVYSGVEMPLCDEFMAVEGIRELVEAVGAFSLGYSSPVVAPARQRDFFDAGFSGQNKSR